MSESPDARLYRCFGDLARCHERDKDYRIETLRRPRSSVAVIAPHGGAIERRTSEIARQIAGEDFNLYLFEGIRPKDNYRRLHLTSHCFDESECLALIAQCATVVAIHGCEGSIEKVLLGGLDASLKARIADALRDADVPVETEGHEFPGRDPLNVCNRGRFGKGVQAELTGAIRGSAREAHLIAAMRSVLLRADAAVN